MEIKKVDNGWEFDGLVFKKKSDALEAKKATEKDSKLPVSLEKDKSKKLNIIYDSENHTSFGHFVSEFIKDTKGEKTILSLANEIGVSKQTFFKWISGESLPSSMHAKDIKRVMKCNNKTLYRALLTNFLKNMARVLDTDVRKIEKFHVETVSEGRSVSS